MFRVVKHENKLALSWISWVFIPRTAEPWVVWYFCWWLSSVLPSRLNFERRSSLGCSHSTQPPTPTFLLAHNMLLFAVQAWSSFIFIPWGAQGNRHTVPRWWWWCIGVGCQMPVCKTLIGFPASLFRMTSQKLENSISFPAAFSHLCLEDSFPTGGKIDAFNWKVKIKPHKATHFYFPQ